MSIAEWIHEQRMRASIKRIRGHFNALGYDTSSMTDEDIVAGTLRFGEAMLKASLTTEDVTRAFAMMVGSEQETHTENSKS